MDTNHNSEIGNFTIESNKINKLPGRYIASKEFVASIYNGNEKGFVSRIKLVVDLALYLHEMSSKDDNLFFLTQTADDYNKVGVIVMHKDLMMCNDIEQVARLNHLDMLYSLITKIYPDKGMQISTKYSLGYKNNHYVFIFGFVTDEVDDCVISTNIDR
jgi:hypothetical protein